ncbi:MAG TPA: hypothetical protein VFE47_01475 [Tepidisphaeraceae bacterium]|jgi:hypothetical protein|nr:hypothetical protein [Tepidisphaeraceae bacterium]
MKKLLFLVLIVAICAAAFFAKPADPKASLANYLAAHPEPMDSLMPVEYKSPKNEWVAGRFDYKDHILWVDAVAHDKTVYTCIFSHWINRGELKDAIHEDVDTLREKIHKATEPKHEKSKAA